MSFNPYQFPGAPDEFYLSDGTFKRQVAETRKALKTFNAIVASTNTPGTAKAAMEELVNITVRH